MLRRREIVDGRGCLRSFFYDWRGASVSFCPSAFFANVGVGGLTVFERGVDADDGGGAAHGVLRYMGNGAAGAEGDVVGCGYGGAVGEGEGAASGADVGGWRRM